MNYIFFDYAGDTKSDEAAIQRYAELEYQIIRPDKTCNTVKLMIQACNKMIDNSSKGDVIICWYDFMGIICWWLCHFRKLDRKIVALNILLKKKNTLKNRFARYLYRRALCAENFRASVTSNEYGTWLNKLLNIKQEYSVLHDVYFDKYDMHQSPIVQRKKIFGGGGTGAIGC